ncbi:hypothetical protein KFL_003280070 [Klebsormidium nitens]|uniref:Pentatricopeptide repeat domain containing protein n=1 Tax=Klebsormidium nitens TaxID=105231 RepID=A0A1Y1I930_KLENI|nr:hypothetical protein KFL_003280070 [Klebsormidium nitens]|eukprot:GAQ87053.1 hypothetical protein KFL_003280070 [Klebsormidium nitens]
MAPKAFSQLRARIALGASSLVGVQGYLTSWYWQRSLAATEDVPLLAALTQRCCMNGGTFFCDGRIPGASGRYRNAQYYGSCYRDPGGSTINVTGRKKPRLLPGSYQGSQAKPSPWQSLPLSNQASFPISPQRTPQLTHSKPGPACPRPWPSDDVSLSSRPLLIAPLSRAPLNLASFSGFTNGQAAAYSTRATPGASAHHSQLNASRSLLRTANVAADLANDSADVERRALSAQAAFSGRTSESASPSKKPPFAHLETASQSDPQAGCSQSSTAGGGATKSERSPERAQMDPPFLYRASSARPQQGESQHCQMGPRDAYVRGMHLQTKPAEQGLDEGWYFNADGFKSVQWGSIPAEAFERFNWAYSRLEMVPSTTGRFVAVEFATPDQTDADGTNGSRVWSGAAEGAVTVETGKPPVVTQKVDTFEIRDQRLRPRGVETEGTRGEPVGGKGAEDTLGDHQENERVGAAVSEGACECGVVEMRDVGDWRPEEASVAKCDDCSGDVRGAITAEQGQPLRVELEGALADRIPEGKTTLERESAHGAERLERRDASGMCERPEAATVLGAEKTNAGGCAEVGVEQDAGWLEGVVMEPVPAPVPTRPEPLFGSGLNEGLGTRGGVVEDWKAALPHEGLESSESDSAFVGGWEGIRIEGEGALEGLEEALLEEAKLGVGELEATRGEGLASGASVGGEEMVQDAEGWELTVLPEGSGEVGLLRGGEHEQGWGPVQTEEESEFAAVAGGVQEDERGARELLGRVNKRFGREVWKRQKLGLGGSSTKLLSKDVWRRVPLATQAGPSGQTADQRRVDSRPENSGRVRRGSEEKGGRGVTGAVRKDVQDAERGKEGKPSKRARLEGRALSRESREVDDVSRVGSEAEAQSAERSGMLSWADLMAPAAKVNSTLRVDDVSSVGFEAEAQTVERAGMLSWADLMAPAAKAEDSLPPRRMLSWAELMQQVGPPVEAATRPHLPASKAAVESGGESERELHGGQVVNEGIEGVEGRPAGVNSPEVEAAPRDVRGRQEESLDGGLVGEGSNGGAIAKAGLEGLEKVRRDMGIEGERSGDAKESLLADVEDGARRVEQAAVEGPHEAAVSISELRSSTTEAEARITLGGAEEELRKEAAAAKGALVSQETAQAEAVAEGAPQAIEESLKEPEESLLGRSKVQSESDMWQKAEAVSPGLSLEVGSEGQTVLQVEKKQARSVERKANKVMTRGQLVEALGKAGTVQEVGRLVKQVKGGLKARDEVWVMKELRSNGQPVPPYLFSAWALCRPKRRPSRFLVAQAIPAAAAVGRLDEVERLLFADLAASQKPDDVTVSIVDAAHLGEDVRTRRAGVQGALGGVPAAGSTADATEGVVAEALPGLVVQAAAECSLAETFVCNALLEAYVDEGRWQEALAVFDAMRPAGVGCSEGKDGGVVSPKREGEPSEQTRGWVTGENLEDWAEYSDPDLEVEGPVRTSANFDGAVREKRPNEGEDAGIVREDFGWLEQTFQEWLHRDVDRRGGLKHWKDGLTLELPRGASGLAGIGARDVFSYNLAIRACLKGRLEMARIWTLREQMEREGLTPDRVSYNLTIAACSKLPEGTAHFTTRARGEDALALIDEMQQRGIPPNVYTYTAAIDAWARANQAVARALQRAEPSAMVSLFEKMLHDGQKPTVATYGALVNGFAQMGALEDAELAFENLLGSGTKPNAGVVNALLAGCELAGDFGRARRWVDRLEKGGVFRSDETRARLLSVCVNTGGAEWVAARCEELRGGNGSFLEGMRALCQEIVSGDLSGTLPENEAEGTFDEPGPAVQEAVPVEAPLLQSPESATENGSAQSKDADSRSWGVEVKGSGQIDAALYKVLIQALAKARQFSELAPVLREMAGRGATPDVVLINIVLDTCARVNDWEITDAIVDALGQLARAAKEQEVSPMGAVNGLLVENDLAQGHSGNGGEINAEVATGAQALAPIHSAVSSRHAAGEKRHPRLPAAFFASTSELLAAKIDDVTVRARARSLMALQSARGESPETVLAFFSTLCDALWSFGWEKRASLVAGALLGPGFQRGFKDRRPVSKASDKEWALDVRRLGKGAGQAVLFLWLQRAREEFLAGESAPGRIAIVTGFDGRKWAKGEMRAVVEEQLEALEAPFRFSEKNPGRFVGNGFDVREWLMEDGMGAKLALSDGAEEAEQALEAAV